MVALKYLFIFFIFSFLGWILEVIYRSIINKKFINPGFMSGCIVPIYGFGAILINLICNLLLKINSPYKVLIVFFVSMILLSLMEYITGYLLLNIFKLKLWDYSDRKYNLNGFISIDFCLVWGLLSLIYYDFIYYNINNLAIILSNNKISLFILFISTFLLALDLIVTINTLIKLNKYAKNTNQYINLEKLKFSVRVNQKKFSVFYPHLYIIRFINSTIKKKK